MGPWFMTRIEDTFKRLKRPALITFIMGGDPDAKRSVSLLKSLPEAGADIIEIGMPFTDPMADGTVIQMAGSRALRMGMNLRQVLDMVREFRGSDDTTPIVLMGYCNPVLAYGFEAFVRDSKQAGVDGVILVDMPPEESDAFLVHARDAGLDLIRLITPTTDEKRLPKLLEGASGFLYYVSITGVTGAAKADPKKLEKHLAEIRKQTDLPLAVGFGIKTAEDAKVFAAMADAIVVGSSIVQTVADNENAPDLVEKVSAQVVGLAKALG